jgi:hypothetical protein
MDKFLVEIPLDAYLRCLARLDEKSPQYRLLKNAILLYGNSNKPVVHLRCDAERAKLIKSLFWHECPEYLDRLRYYPNRP